MVLGPRFARFARFARLTSLTRLIRLTTFLTIHKIFEMLASFCQKLVVFSRFIFSWKLDIIGNLNKYVDWKKGKNKSTGLLWMI